MPPLAFAVVALIAAVALSGGAPTPDCAIAIGASGAALVAMRERRHRDVGIAAGIAVGVSTIGLVLLPVLLGTVIARRTMGATLPCFVMAAIGSALLVGGVPAPHRSLAAVLPDDLLVLLPVTAIGVAAWLAASCAARPPSVREQDAAALLASLALPMLAPIGVEAMGLAVALAIGGTRLTLSPIARVANDVPPPLRPLPA